MSKDMFTMQRPSYGEMYYPIENTMSTHILKRGGGYDSIAFDADMCDCPHCNLQKYQYGEPCYRKIGAIKRPVFLNRRC